MIKKQKAAHLRFWLQTAYESGNKNHPQTTMEELKITYQFSTPIPMGDNWIFWNCENLPSKLPNFLKIADVNPESFIDSDLTKDEVEKIIEYKNKKQ